MIVLAGVLAWGPTWGFRAPPPAPTASFCRDRISLDCGLSSRRVKLMPLSQSGFSAHRLTCDLSS
jgi:hypothetical protein